MVDEIGGRKILTTPVWETMRKHRPFWDISTRLP